MPVVKPGSDWDVHGCIRSAGYIWCDILQRCLRNWQEVCDYPKNCLAWYDGCNTCNLVDGELGVCTRQYCYTLSVPYCSVPAPEVSIEPWLMNPPQPVIDPMPLEPMPPVINPFIGDGH